jgi:hypothetical protein
MHLSKCSQSFPHSGCCGLKWRKTHFGKCFNKQVASSGACTRKLLVAEIGTTHFKKCKQLLKYQHFLLLNETSGSQNFIIYSNLVHFFNTSVN